MPTETVVSATNFSYRYGDFTAVQGLDLAVARGEVYALLGTNGAGKTTTLEVIEGHRRPTSGSVSVLGGDPTDRRRIRPRVGIMLQESGFAGELSTIESLRLAGRLSGRDDSADELLDTVDLRSKAETRVVQLSGGEKRRLDFAMAIWGAPELVFLDEPTTGLDPTAREALWEVVGDLRDQGTTVILTTHYLEEAQRYADRIGLMHGGVLQREGTLAELVAAEPSHIRFVAPPGADLPLPISSTEHGLVVVTTDDLQGDLTALLAWADRGNHRLDQLSAASSSLDDLFRDLTTGAHS
ncbi:MAG: transporter related [Rhodoglobus sp.]|nr:transporter related [Rhodoglobus sp.]